MFSKHNESTEILCQFKQETSVVIESFDGSLIASIEEQRTTPLPVDIYKILIAQPLPLQPKRPEVDHGMSI